jgi:hypothetical protein
MVIGPVGVGAAPGAGMVRGVIVATLSPALGPLLVAALLLVPAGLAKIRRPAPTGLALARLGLPGSDPLVRVLGVVELVAAAVAVAIGGVAAVGVAVLYVGFALISAAQVVRAARTGEAADCGCFGDDSAPVGWSHVVVNLLLAAGAVAAVVVGADGVGGALGSSIPGTIGVVLVAGVAAAGTRAVLTDLAAVRALMATPAEG